MARLILIMFHSRIPTWWLWSKKLRMALLDRLANEYLTNHSDCENLFCCHEHLNQRKDKNLVKNITQENHYDVNESAEREDRISKEEYAPDDNYRSINSSSISVTYSGKFEDKIPDKTSRFFSPHGAKMTERRSRLIRMITDFCRLLFFNWWCHFVVS